MIIKVLGSGCKKCKKLEKNAKKAVKELGVNVTVVKVDNPMDIANYGVMSTPALVINDRVMTSGRIPDVTELKGLFKAALH